MEDKKNIRDFLKLFYQDAASTFTMAIVTMSLAGIASRNTAGSEYVFVLRGGISFEMIIQFFLWSCIMSTLVTVLTSDIWFRQVMLIWRVAIVGVVGSAITIAFATIFSWIPLDNPTAWAFFLGFFTVGFGSGLGFLLITTKIKDKQYNQLLTEYRLNKKEAAQ